MAGAPRLVLASGSPRRRDLLLDAGLVFDVVAPDVDESQLPGEAPVAHVERLARTKAHAVHDAVAARPLAHQDAGPAGAGSNDIRPDTAWVEVATHPTGRRDGIPPGTGAWVVLGADTVVVLDGQVLGKPKDPTDACATLARLSGRRHQVLTGVAVVSAAPTRTCAGGVVAHTVVVHTDVTFRPLSPDEIEAYVATGEPLDKAGSYAIQGDASPFVAGIDGSYTNVVGLPVEETLALLAEAGVNPLSGCRRDPA